MIALYVFLALVAADIVYSIYDNHQSDALEQMDDFYAVEQKKCFLERNELSAMCGR